MKDSNTFLVETLRSLTSIPSPSGRTEQNVGWTVELLQSWGFEPELTLEGNQAKLPGKDSSRARALTAHSYAGSDGVAYQRQWPMCMAPVRTCPAASQRGESDLQTDEHEYRGRSNHFGSGHAYNEKSISNLSTGNK